MACWRTKQSILILITRIGVGRLGHVGMMNVSRGWERASGLLHYTTVLYSLLEARWDGGQVGGWKRPGRRSWRRL